MLTTAVMSEQGAMPPHTFESWGSIECFAPLFKTELCCINMMYTAELSGKITDFLKNFPE